MSVAGRSIAEIERGLNEIAKLTEEMVENVSNAKRHDGAVAVAAFYAGNIRAEVRKLQQ